MKHQNFKHELDIWQSAKVFQADGLSAATAHGKQGLPSLQGVTLMPSVGKDWKGNPLSKNLKYHEIIP